MISEAIDQAAHALIGALLAWLLLFVMPGWGAVVVVMAGAVGREYVQHEGLRFGAGARRDLFFWFIGAVIGVAIGA